MDQAGTGLWCPCLFAPYSDLFLKCRFGIGLAGDDGKASGNLENHASRSNLIDKSKREQHLSDSGAGGTGASSPGIGNSEGFMAKAGAFNETAGNRLDIIATSTATETFLEFPDNRRLVELCGVNDENLKQIEDVLGIQIVRRGNRIVLLNDGSMLRRGAETLRYLYEQLEHGSAVDAGEIDHALRFRAASKGLPEPEERRDAKALDEIEIKTKSRKVRPRTSAQSSYARALLDEDIVFGIGPAGTGKTYLAVAVAVEMFRAGRVDRIVLCRPAVEAGERIGFLPGDMKEKVDPFMRPLYDALHAFLPANQVARLIDENRIEIAPLAFMRGRTLSFAFILLDEAQNTTSMQMKMFLTRLGMNSRMAVTGDITQIDLPKGVESGLIEARKLLGGIKGIAFMELTSADVARNALVERIINAYAQG